MVKFYEGKMKRRKIREGRNAVEIISKLRRDICFEFNSLVDLLTEIWGITFVQLYRKPLYY